MTKLKVDPITLQVIRGAMETIAEEMAHVLFRMSFSSIIRESEDLGAGLFDRDFNTLCESESTPMHIGSILVYNPETAPGGFVRFKDILAFFESRMQLSKTIRQRMVRVPFDLDYPYWIEDPDFDLEYHVRHVALPQPGDWRQLCIQAARIFARPLDLTRPPWEFTVVEGIDGIAGVPKGSYAMVTKVHHAAIDGMSGIDLMEAMHTLRADDGPPDTPDTWKPEKVGLRYWIWLS